jgi:myo-inositol 2-dehydrogenase / D-chiro-inositol 1-dehydrogenase
MREEKMRIAFVGAGWVANRHLRSLATEADVEVVGHISPLPKELDVATHRWGGRGYRTVKDLLANEKVDAAWITVPPGEHGEIEAIFLDQGIPLFIEKPLSADRETGERIGAAIREKGVIAAVGYHWRAMETIPEVRQSLASNPVRMVLAAWHDSTPPPLWWRHHETSGGQMVEQATHLVDLARYLVGEARLLQSCAADCPRAAYPDADVASVSAALLRFAEDVPGVFSATCVLGGPAEIYVKLVCEGLLITITQTGVTYETGKEKREVRLEKDPFLIEDRAFLQAVRGDDPRLLFSSYEDALKTHALCHDILEQYQTG